jgi:hypothetical protein
MGRSRGLALPNAEPPSVETLRGKLDAAIVSEEWAAVSAVHERLVQMERHAAGNVVDYEAARAKRRRP